MFFSATHVADILYILQKVQITVAEIFLQIVKIPKNDKNSGLKIVRIYRKYIYCVYINYLASRALVRPFCNNLDVAFLYKRSIFVILKNNNISHPFT